MMSNAALLDMVTKRIRAYRADWKEFQEELASAGIDYRTTHVAAYPKDLRNRCIRLEGDRHAVHCLIQVVISDGDRWADLEDIRAIVNSDTDPRELLAPYLMPSPAAA
ncbi:hypothetical protein ABZ470_23765 [Streptosporangium sp. NPDC020072]|uniref:hypothetical protein n=1 Tax=Streptosporangium sp. NPDC020072 TaxID=3154788 RepID=UPI00341DC999